MICGLLLILLELATPVFVYVFLGLGALATGALAATGHLVGLDIQIAAFALFSLVLTLSLRRFAKRTFKGITADVANSDLGFDEFIGRTAMVVAVVEEAGTCRVSFRGSEWDATSLRSVSIDEYVEITGRRGSVLIVESKTKSKND